MKKELEILSVGDLYQVTHEVSFYDNDCYITTHIDRDDVVLLVDNRYFFIYVDEDKFKKKAEDVNLFNPFPNLEKAKMYYESFGKKTVFIKIMFDNVVGYANFQNFALLDKI